MKTLPFAALKTKLNRNCIPLYASIEVITDCNFNCVHCYIPNNKRAKLLKLKDIKYIVDELDKAGMMEIVITGGEPMLHPDIYDILDYIINKKNKNVILFSNASLIDDTAVSKLKKFRFLTLDISLYGYNKDTYKNITGKDEYDKVFKAIDLLKKNNIKFNLKMQLLKENYKEFSDIKRFTEKNKISLRYSYYIIPDWNRNRKNQKHLLDKNELRIIIKEAGDILPYDECIDIIGRGKIKGVCSVARSTVGVTVEGDILPCISMRYPAGNIFNDNFYEVWNNSDILKEIRDLTFKKIARCCDCKLQPGCLVCPGLAWHDNGTFKEAFEQMCTMTEIRYEEFEKKQEDIC